MKTSIRHMPTNQRGIVLVSTLAIVMVATIIAIAIYKLSKVDVDITGNQIHAADAFFHADAGVAVTVRAIENILEADSSIVLADLARTLNVTAPDGFLFSAVHGLTAVDTNSLVYSFDVNSQSEDASAHLEATFRRKPVFDLGIFGDLAVSVQPGDTILSYNSNEHPANYIPGLTESTGEADIGSNSEVSFQPNTINDGLVVLGEDNLGQLADCDNCDTREVIELDETINADPLGINGGAMDQMFTYVETHNNNSSSTAITGANKINGNPHQHITLTAGNYYLSEFDLKGELTIDTSGGPVNIFLTGPLKFWPGSIINYSGKPTEFMIFSNSYDPITVLPNSDFKGIVVAPNAEIRMLPNHDFFGTLWGRQVRLQPGGHVYVDTALQERMLSNELEQISWKEHRTI